MPVLERQRQEDQKSKAIILQYKASSRPASDMNTLSRNKENKINKQANTFELFNHVLMILNGFLQDQFGLVHLPPPLSAHRIRMVPVNTER